MPEFHTIHYELAVENKNTKTIKSAHLNNSNVRETTSLYILLRVNAKITTRTEVLKQYTTILKLCDILCFLTNFIASCRARFAICYFIACVLLHAGA